MGIAAGTRLGPYQIVGSVGAGGMGEVYRAPDTRLDRTVAIKILPRNSGSAASRSDRSRRRPAVRRLARRPAVSGQHARRPADAADHDPVELAVRRPAIRENSRSRLRFIGDDVIVWKEAPSRAAPTQKLRPGTAAKIAGFETLRKACVVSGRHLAV
jgi:hypothetical protein